MPYQFVYSNKISKEFLKPIILRDEYCSLNNGIPEPVVDDYVNLYVKVTSRCHYNCKFCEYHSFTSKKLDCDKLILVLNKIKNSGTKVRKFSVTGGEPTKIDIDILRNILYSSKYYFPDVFNVINTNGNNLLNLVNSTNELVDSYSISIHHYDNHKLVSIFGDKYLDISNDLKELISKYGSDKFHVSCNLIKGYIDSSEEVLKYLNWLSSLGVTDVGFVSLMSINQFCKDNYVDAYKVLGNIDSPRFIRTKCWNDKDRCECSNYMYIPDNSTNVMKVYSRYCKNHNQYSPSTLVYDINELKDRFNGYKIF